MLDLSPICECESFSIVFALVTKQALGACAGTVRMRSTRPRRDGLWTMVIFLVSAAALWGCGSGGSSGNGAPGGISGTSGSSSASGSSSGSGSSGASGSASTSGSPGGSGNSGTSGTGEVSGAAPSSLAAAAGEAIFFDKSLSASGVQSCGTCHVPTHAFAGDPATDHGLPVPLGGPHMDQTGLRNTPSLMYASLTPPFSLANGPVGGIFRDGRASSLATQAQQ